MKLFLGICNSEAEQKCCFATMQMQVQLLDKSPSSPATWLPLSKSFTQVFCSGSWEVPWNAHSIIMLPRSRLLMMCVEPLEYKLDTILKSQNPGAEWKFKEYLVWWVLSYILVQEPCVFTFVRMHTHAFQRCMLNFSILDKSETEQLWFKGERTPLKATILAIFPVCLALLGNPNILRKLKIPSP